MIDALVNVWQATWAWQRYALPLIAGVLLFGLAVRLVATSRRRGSNAAAPETDRHRFLAWLTASGGLAALAIWGLAFESSIRSDPFNPTPGLGEWAFDGQPHPALARLPVVPIGARGTLTFRPRITGWINDPDLPAGIGAGEAGDDTAPVQTQGSLLVGTARAADAPPSKGDASSAPAEVQQIPMAPAIRLPSAIGKGDSVQPAVEDAADARDLRPAVPADRVLKPRLPAPADDDPATRRQIRHAQCDVAGEVCWIGGALGVFATRDGGASWARVFPTSYQPTRAPTPRGPDASLFHFAAAAAVPGAAQVAAANADDATATRTDTLAWIEAAGETVVSDDGATSWAPLGRQREQGGSALDLAPTTIRQLVWDDLDQMWFGLPAPDPAATRYAPGLITAEVWVDQPPPPFNVFFTTTGRAFLVPHGEGRVPVTATSLASTNIADAALDAGGPLGQRHVLLARRDDSGRTVWWIGGDGGGLVRFVRDDDWRQVDTGTAAPIRSIAFQPDGRVGWASSGWGDGGTDADRGPDDRPILLQTTDGGETWEILSYRHLPAPWILYLVLPGLVISVFGAATSWLDGRRAAPPKASVADEASSDNPIGWSDRDALGLQPIARALSKFIRNRNTEPPLTFAITGAWGSGKSSLMNLVAEDLRDFDCQPVWFNAWHHQKEQHLLAALLENIRAQAIPSWWRFSGLMFRLRLVWLRSARMLGGLVALVAIIFLASAALAWFLDSEEVANLGDAITRLVTESWSERGLEALIPGLTALGSLGAAAYAIVLALFRLRVLTLNPAKLMTSVTDHARVGDLRDQLGFRYKFRREFGEVCRAMRGGGRSPGIVILIDDLDRCQPANVLEILEAVNFLTSAGPCFIFLGIDAEKVTSSVAYSFKDSVLIVPKTGAAPDPAHVMQPDAHELARFARNYLEKLINITVPVPTATADAAAAILGAGVGTAPASPHRAPWPQRVRRLLTSGMDHTRGAIALAASAAAVVFVVSSLTPPPTPDQAATAASPAQTAATGQQPAADARDDGGSGAPDSDTGPSTEQPSTPTVTALLEPMPAVDPITLTDDPLWFDAAIAAGLVAAAVLILLIGRLLTVREDVVRDSPEFRQALTIWNEVIFSACPTPRGVKRYQNRLRYLAMRARGDDRPPDWIDRLVAGFGLPTRANTASAGPANGSALPEATLVALGALAAARPELLNGQDAALDLVHRLLIGEGDQVTPGDPLAAAARASAQSTSGWPPTLEQITAFRALAGTVDG